MLAALNENTVDVLDAASGVRLAQLPTEGRPFFLPLRHRIVVVNRHRAEVWTLPPRAALQLQAWAVALLRKIPR